MYRISKQFAFEASHQLLGLPEGHQCGRNHGHSYRVEVILESDILNEHSFIRDYGELDEFANYLKNHFDHRFLNDVLLEFGVTQTSAENIARSLYFWCSQRWPEVVEVRVSETQKTWASYSERGN